MSSPQDFTSVIKLLRDAGHVGYLIQVKDTVGNFMRGKKPYMWFPGLQIVVSVDTNTTYQVRRDDNGVWKRRINRKNGWISLESTPAGQEFCKMIEPHYVKYLNGLIMEEMSDVESKGCSLQGSSGKQAT